jgi:hypothetical protein
MPCAAPARAPARRIKPTQRTQHAAVKVERGLQAGADQRDVVHPVDHDAAGCGAAAGARGGGAGGRVG